MIVLFATVTLNQSGSPVPDRSVYVYWSLEPEADEKYELGLKGKEKTIPAGNVSFGIVPTSIGAASWTTILTGVAVNQFAPSTFQ